MIIKYLDFLFLRKEDSAWSLAESGILLSKRTVSPRLRFFFNIFVRNILKNKDNGPDGSQNSQMGKTRVFFLTARHCWS